MAGRDVSAAVSAAVAAAAAAAAATAAATTASSSSGTLSSSGGSRLGVPPTGRGTTVLPPPAVAAGGSAAGGIIPAASPLRPATAVASASGAGRPPASLPFASPTQAGAGAPSTTGGGSVGAGGGGVSGTSPSPDGSVAAAAPYSSSSLGRKSQQPQERGQLLATPGAPAGSRPGASSARRKRSLEGRLPTSAVARGSDNGHGDRSEQAEHVGPRTSVEFEALREATINATMRFAGGAGGGAAALQSVAQRIKEARAAPAPALGAGAGDSSQPSSTVASSDISLEDWDAGVEEDQLQRGGRKPPTTVAPVLVTPLGAGAIKSPAATAATSAAALVGGGGGGGGGGGRRGRPLLLSSWTRRLPSTCSSLCCASHCAGDGPHSCRRPLALTRQHG